MTFTFTFGHGHECRCGRSLTGCYTHVEGADELAARERMVSLWDVKWCGCYESDEAAGVEEHGLKRIVSNFDDPERCPCSRGPRPTYVLVALECCQCDRRAGALVLPRSEETDTLAMPKLDARAMCEECREALRRMP